MADDVSNNLNACFAMSSESRSTSPTAALGQRSSARTCSSDNIHAGESSDTISMLRSPKHRGPKHVTLSKANSTQIYTNLIQFQNSTCRFLGYLYFFFGHGPLSCLPGLPLLEAHWRRNKRWLMLPTQSSQFRDLSCEHVQSLNRICRTGNLLKSGLKRIGHVAGVFQ